MINEILENNIQRSIEVHSQFKARCLPEMASAAEALVYAYQRGHKALFFGNGGSAADHSTWQWSFWGVICGSASLCLP